MDLNRPLCCLCGDVGFPAKLFRCANCSNRFQHSYCSNFYCGESADPITRLCDWCRTEHTTRRPSPAAANNGATSQKPHKMTDQITETKSSATGVPSPRPAPRRYKLLKDVMC
ncbi:uncharacterized protein LOC111432109 [Cucurbita moschata]|uniref:Uncharacterized protein LOC111432109 n=1 Tax=Cucurbita moschata TaxID=3662 RepID=A0A6J1ED69_CUCMO|nr:uncharacterized protein LOC111432109 [Cucurbita moschata]